jgi:hypothetical protein
MHDYENVVTADKQFGMLTAGADKRGLKIINEPLYFNFWFSKINKVPICVHPRLW